MERQQIERLESMYLSMKKNNILHEWINALSKVDNSLMMSITEKAKTVTLFDTSILLDINPNKILNKVGCLSLVRKEINKQKRFLARKPTIHQKINVKSWFSSQRELPETYMRITRYDSYNRSDYVLERQTPCTNDKQFGRTLKKDLFNIKF